jgi:SAM-dependent methyltransferase
VSRWSRAARTLSLPEGSRVLDLGCAFGWGTRLLVRRYRTYGHDLSAAYIERARRLVPAATFSIGPADRVPYDGGYFDGILLLDVLEHVPNDRAVICEVSRVLRPGGRLVLSVPNRGALAPLDSLNLYHRLTGGRRLPPTDDPSWPSSLIHRHYSLGDLRELLGEDFRIRQTQYTGIGVAEPVNLVVALLFRALLPLPRVYEILQYLYFGVYLAEDHLHTGAWGYHLMIEAERR